MWIAIISLCLIIGLVVLLLTIISPGKLEPLKDKTGKPIHHSISEKVKLEIGGVEQQAFILGEKKENPVLLFLHGGPGSPELPLVFTNDGDRRLEEEFIVCYWDQRGSGMSRAGIPVETMTLEQLIADTHEITQYLKKRFNQEKIYIIGHSWGSFLGIKVVNKYPDDYFAYIGMGQLSDQRLSEQLAFHYMWEHAHKIKDKKAIKALSNYDSTSNRFPELPYIMSIRSSLMNKYGIGITHTHVSMKKVMKQIFFFKGYTLIDKINYMRGSLFSLKTLFHYTLKDDLAKTTTAFELPIYIIHGKFDYQVSYELAKSYAEKILAPKKKFFTFEESAHSPIIEEREKFIETMKVIKQACQ